MSKRRKGFPSEKKVKRGVRIVHGNKELTEKLGRNDLCPCGSTKLFKKCCLKKGCFRWRESGRLLLGNDEPPARLNLPSRYDACGGSDGEEHLQERKANPTENRREGQTLPLRQVPQTKPETCENPSPLVLPELLEGGTGK